MRRDTDAREDNTITARLLLLLRYIAPREWGGLRGRRGYNEEGNGILTRNKGFRER